MRTCDACGQSVNHHPPRCGICGQIVKSSRSKVYVVERRDEQGQLDFRGEQPPWIVASEDELFRWYFNNHPGCHAAGYDALNAALKEKGWSIREKTW